VSRSCPDPSRASADDRGGDDARRKDEPYEAARDRSSLGPRLAARVGANVLNQLQSNGTVIGDVSHADAFELNIGANDIPYNRTRAARRSIATRASRSDGRT